MTQENNNKEMVVIYDFYDSPLNYVYREGNQYYYAHLISETSDGADVFWVVRVSPERIKKAEQGDIDLRTLLREPEDGKIQIRTSEEASTEISIHEALKFFSEYYFPKSGTLLFEEYGEPFERYEEF